MEAGARIPIPECFESLPGWVEVRRVSNGTGALLYRVLELYYAVPRPNSLESVLQTMLASDYQFDNIKKNSPVEVLQPKPLESLLENLPQLSLDSTTLQRNLSLLEYWQLQVTYPAFDITINPSGSVVIPLHYANSAWFLLYPTYSFESFIDLRCGHFGVKYDYFRLLEQENHGRAVSVRNLKTRPIQCLDCNAAIEIMDILAERKNTVRTNKCKICSALSPRKCACKETVCFNCIIKNLMTESYAFMPCCYSQIDELVLCKAYKQLALKEGLKRHLAKLPYLRYLERIILCSVCQNAVVSSEGPCETCRKNAERPKQESPRTLGHTSPSKKASEEPNQQSSDGEETKGDVPSEYQTQKFITPSTQQRKPEVEEEKILPPVSEAPSTSVPARECRNCQVHYTQLDRNWQCIRQCYCALCTAALSASFNYQQCSYCNAPFEADLIAKLQGKWGKCHCCGLGIFKTDLVKGVDCFVCKACVEITANKDVREIKCYSCTRVYAASQEDYSIIPNASILLNRNACCTFDMGNLKSKGLKCGHLVCCRHWNTLQMCRRCHKPAEIMPD